MIQLQLSNETGTELKSMLVFIHMFHLVSDIAIFVLKRDVKLQLTNMFHHKGNVR